MHAFQKHSILPVLIRIEPGTAPSPRIQQTRTVGWQRAFSQWCRELFIVSWCVFATCVASKVPHCSRKRECSSAGLTRLRLQARGTTVIADYTAYTGNFSTVAIQCLEKCPTDNSKFTFTCDRHTFNYTVDGGYSESSRPPPLSLLPSPLILSFSRHIGSSVGISPSDKSKYVRCCVRRSSHRNLLNPCSSEPVRSIPGCSRGGLRAAGAICLPGACSGGVEGEVR